MVPIRAELSSTPDTGIVIAEKLVRSDSPPSEPGVKKGFRRTGIYENVRMPLFVRFTPTLERTPPRYYAFPASDTAVAKLLRLHGLRVTSLDKAWSGDVEAFVVDSIVKSTRPFQGHLETRLKGRWMRQRRTISAGSFVVAPADRFGVLAVYLLEPESDDGLVDWNFFDGGLARGKAFPVLRLLDPPAPVFDH